NANSDSEDGNDDGGDSTDNANGDSTDGNDNGGASSDNGNGDSTDGNDNGGDSSDNGNSTDGNDNGGDSSDNGNGNGDSGDAPPVTVNDFISMVESGSQIHKTELLSKAISHLNAGLDDSEQVTIMDFLKGTVIDGNLHMEFDLQAIVDAINGESSDTSGGDGIEIELDGDDDNEIVY
ncbi:MAG: hypothetical protein CMD33_08465, partial [Flavobacteriales bacterium]|nr:hypothetical protein [Flavobacteriales bacterium]